MVRGRIGIHEFLVTALVHIPGSQRERGFDETWRQRRDAELRAAYGDAENRKSIALRLALRDEDPWQKALPAISGRYD